MAAPEPVVEASEQGAGELGSLYWRGRALYARPRRDQRGRGWERAVRLRPGSLVLLAFGPPERTAAKDGVRCTYPIVNGFLVRTAGATISFSQEAGPPLALASAITGFFPRLAASPGRPGWTGALYEQVQRRLHQAVSKRYFRALPRPGASMKVVVFGATGTIGAALVTALTGDHEVTAVSRSPKERRDERGVRWVRADVDLRRWRAGGHELRRHDQTGRATQGPRTASG